MTNHTQHSSPEADQEQTGADDPKKTKAAIILGLIEQGVIPKPSDDFVEELVNFSGRRHSVKLRDIEDASRKLARYFGAKSTAHLIQPLGDTATGSKEDDDPLKTAGIPREVHAETGHDLGLQLRDQHAAIIKNHLNTLSDDEMKLAIKALPGKTARQVALLNFQSSQRRKES